MAPIRYKVVECAVNKYGGKPRLQLSRGLPSVGLFLGLRIYFGLLGRRVVG
jgi:hypothetical protein